MCGERVAADGRALGRLSTAAQEQLVQVREAHLVPGRAAVIALAGTLGFFHLAQQRVHLRYRQGPVGAHRAMTRHGPEQLVPALGEHATRPVLAEVPQHRARESSAVLSFS